MKKITYKWVWALVVLTIVGIASVPALADDYPGVYAGEDKLVFVQAVDEQGALQGLVVLSYEYSMDWIITAASSGSRTETGLSLANGRQYVYNADGSRRSESEFSSMDLTVDWTALEFQVLPSYGFYLAPMVRGGLAYALVENRSGLPSQLVLAREAYDNGETINLFEGFIYQLSEGRLTAQIAFTETAFGSQGLVRGAFPENFPPPPEDYPNPYPAYPGPSYGPDGSSQASNPGAGQIFDPTLPQGTEVSPEEALNRPRFILEPIHDYDVPAIKRIGVVAFQSTAEIEGYGPECDEMLTDALSGIEGVEIVQIPYDDSRFGGLVMYDRAVWLCQEYGVDALMINGLTKLEMPTGATSTRPSPTFRVNAGVRGKLIEGVGGSMVWTGNFESIQVHDSYEAQDGEDPVLRADLLYVIQDMVDDMMSNKALDARHVD